MIAHPVFLPAKPTGADLVNAVAEHARQLGCNRHALMAQLSSDPRKWEHQTASAKSPKSHTIERVRKLLSGEPVPPPPANNFQSTSPFGGGKIAEAEVIRRREAGESLASIIENTGIARAVAARAVTSLTDGELAARQRDCVQGSSALRTAVMAECARREQRLKAARSTSSVRQALDHADEGMRPVLRGPSVLIRNMDDPRPVAMGRDPCPRCGTRGDLGCKHFRPADDLPAAPLDVGETGRGDFRFIESRMLASGIEAEIAEFLRRYRLTRTAFCVAIGQSSSSFFDKAREGRLKSATVEKVRAFMRDYPDQLAHLQGDH